MSCRPTCSSPAPEPDFDIDAHRVRCTVYVRPDWPGNVASRVTFYSPMPFRHSNFTFPSSSRENLGMVNFSPPGPRRRYLGDAEPSAGRAGSRSGRAPTARATISSPRAAGLEGVSSHGCRIGMAQSLACTPGVEIPAIMQTVGWRSESMASRYIARESVRRGAVAKF